MTKLLYLFGGALLSLIAAVSISTTVAQVPVNHIVKGGQLTGAENVSVNGTLYNVTFLGGTCVDIFDGCDEAANFEFADESTARWTPLTRCSRGSLISSMLAGRYPLAPNTRPAYRRIMHWPG